MGLMLKLPQILQFLVETLGYYKVKGMCGTTHGLSPRVSHEIVYIDHKKVNLRMYIKS